MTALVNDLNETSRVMVVDAPLSSPSYPLFYTLDNETVKVTGAADTVTWEIERGVGNSDAASHASRTFVVSASNPFGGGGGGSLSVTDGTTTVDNVTTLQFARTLTDVGAGVAAPFFVANLPGYEVRGSDDASSTGAYVQVYDATDPTGGLVNIEAGDSDIGHGGGGITISGGYGNGAQTNPGQFIAHGGGAAADGTVDIQTEGSTGNNGQMLVANSGSHTVWRDLLSSGSGAPAGTFTTPLYVDTSGKHLYAWSGSAYVLVSDYA